MPTLTSYRQRTAILLGSFHASTSDSSGNTTTILQDTSVLQSTLSLNRSLVGKWLFVPGAATADKLRRIKSFSAADGQLTVDDPTSAAPTSLAYEIHGILNPHTNGQNGLEDIINIALKRIFIPVEFTFQASDAQNVRHSLAAGVSAWLTNESWIYQVGYLTATEVTAGRAKHNPFVESRLIRGGFLERDGGTLYISGFRHNTSDTMYVKALKPAYFHCRATSGGTFGDRSGVNAEAHEAVPDVEWVAAAARVEAWNRVPAAMAATVQDGGDIDQARQEAADYLRAQTRYWFKEPTRVFDKPAVWTFGPSR